MPLSETLKTICASVVCKRDADAAGRIVAGRVARRDRLRSHSSAHWSAPGETSRPSHSNQMRSRGTCVSKVICGWATRCRNTACCNSSCAHSRRITGVRHAREGREFVDHAADIADLADDGVGALLEDFAVVA